MAYIQKRINKTGGVSYRVQVRIKGHPIQCATFKEKTKAEKWARKMEIAIDDGQHLAIIESKKHTLKELIERYTKDVLPTKSKTRRETERHLAIWKELLGDYFLIAIKPDLIMEARDKIAARETPKGGKKTPATLNRYLASLSVVFSYAYKNLEWIEINPIEKIRKYTEPKGRVRYLTDDERERLIAEVRKSPNPLLYPVVMLAITTGARSSEILNLRWEDINLEEQRAILQETKNGERRTLSIVEPALSALRKLKAKNRGGQYVFYARRETGEEHSADITKSWYKALDDSGIKDFRFHDLRHTCASYLAMHGASLAEIAEILGHKTLQMTKRYSHLSDRHKQSVVERVMSKEIFGDTGGK